MLTQTKYKQKNELLAVALFVLLRFLLKITFLKTAKALINKRLYIKNKTLQKKCNVLFFIQVFLYSFGKSKVKPYEN